jgi:hypothetical protein
MVYFQTKNPNVGKFWRVLQWKMLVYFMAILSILQPFGKFYGHFVYFPQFWYIFPRFGMLHQEKSGNPVLDSSQKKRKKTVFEIRKIFFRQMAIFLSLARFPRTGMRLKLKSAFFIFYHQPARTNGQH